MPCHVCAVKSEDYPKPAIFKTPFMSTAIPYFDADTDFLCPRCFLVYFHVIELKYGSVIARLHGTSVELFSSAPPPPPPPPPVPPPEPSLNYTAYSSMFAPEFADFSMAAALNDIWDLEFLLAAVLNDLPSASFGARPGSPPAVLMVKRTHRYMPPRDEPPAEHRPCVPPIKASATLTIDFPRGESKLSLKRKREEI